MPYGTAILDAFELALPAYLAHRSSLPAIISMLRARVGAGDSNFLTAGCLSEAIYHRMASGDMGRGDVVRAVAAARRDLSVVTT